jgi:phage terminase small subunit
VAKPDLPSWLAGASDPVARDVFDELSVLLVGLKVLTIAEQEALAQLADKIALYRRLRVEMYDGFSYECQTESGAIMRRIKPEVQPFLDISRQISQGLATFGLTPSSRTKIETIGVSDRDPLEEFLGHGT